MTGVSDRPQTDILRQIGWLSQVSPHLQDAVLVRSDVLRLGPGEALFRNGDDAGGIYGVVEGWVELHIHGSDAQATLCYVGGPGFWSGHLAAVRGHPRKFTEIARTACVVLRLPRAEMLRICEEEPQRWREFSLLLANNLARAIDVAAMLRQRPSVARVAQALLMLTEHAADGSATAPVSQADLGAITQLSRASVAASLSKLERRGCVRRRYASIDVLDAGALSRLTRGEPG